MTKSQLSELPDLCEGCVAEVRGNCNISTTPDGRESPFLTLFSKGKEITLDTPKKVAKEVKDLANFILLQEDLSYILFESKNPEKGYEKNKEQLFQFLKSEIESLVKKYAVHENTKKVMEGIMKIIQENDAQRNPSPILSFLKSVSQGVDRHSIKGAALQECAACVESE